MWGAQFASAAGKLKSTFADVHRWPGESANFLKDTLAGTRAITSLAASVARVNDVSTAPRHHRRATPPVKHRRQAAVASVSVTAAAGQYQAPADQ